MSPDNDIYRAVQAAIAVGMTPRQFIEAVAAVWSEELDEVQKHANQDFRELLARPVR